MGLRFASLGSGSSGNATLISNGKSAILVDCGFSVKETESRLANLGLDASQLDGILLTHEHGDHAKGVMPLARKYQVPVYLSRGTQLGAKIDRHSPLLNVVVSEKAFEVGALRIFPVTVPHDAREPLQFTIECVEHGRRIGVLTDLGSVTPKVVSVFSGCHGLLVEANHDLDMLARGPYPPSLQRRVGGNWGHLNNAQTMRLLEELDLSMASQVVIGHISQKNNSVESVSNALAPFRSRFQGQLSFATQDSGFNWITLR